MVAEFTNKNEISLSFNLNGTGSAKQYDALIANLALSFLEPNAALHFHFFISKMFMISLTKQDYRVISGL